MPKAKVPTGFNFTTMAKTAAKDAAEDAAEDDVEETPVSATPAAPAAPATPAAPAEEEWPYGPLPLPGGQPWSTEYQEAREKYLDVAARAAQRRQERGYHGYAPGLDPREWTYTTDPESQQMADVSRAHTAVLPTLRGIPSLLHPQRLDPKGFPVSPDAGDWAAAARSRPGWKRADIPLSPSVMPLETWEGLEAEKALKEVPPVEGAVQLSGVGPGTEKQRLVKAVEAGFRVDAPGPTRNVAPLEIFSEWSGRGLPRALGPQTRPEGTSWFIAPEPGTEGFDVVKVREKLLTPAEADISGKMHFGHTAGVESEGDVFSEGDISLPRLAAYRDALRAERVEAYARYDSNNAELLKALGGWRQATLGSGLVTRYDASGAITPRLTETVESDKKELRRLDADIKRVNELTSVLTEVALAAGISMAEVEAVKVSRPSSESPHPPASLRRVSSASLQGVPASLEPVE